MTRIDAYGNIDELNSFIGHIHDQDINKNQKIPCFCSETTIKFSSIISFDGRKNPLNYLNYQLKTYKKLKMK